MQVSLNQGLAQLGRYKPLQQRAGAELICNQLESFEKVQAVIMLLAMERTTLREILERADGVRRQGTSEPPVFVVSDSVEATLLCEAASEVVAVERLIRVELGASHVVTKTVRGDCYYFPYEKVIGLRVVPSKEKQRDRGAGFR